MKKSTVFFAVAVSAVLVMMTSGCKHREVTPTTIPGNHLAPIEVPPTVNVNPPNDRSLTLPPTTEHIETVKPGSDIPFDRDGIWTNVWNGPLTPNPEFFAKDTIYFDTDASSIKASEQAKLDDIIKYFKENKTDVLMIEGYCDERGTEGYNMSLGDKRSLAIREYLATAGVEAGRIHTVSFGESKPVDPGHNEEAWKKNRRGVSVLMQPK